MINLVKNKNIMFSRLCCILIFILLIIPTGFTKQIFLSAMNIGKSIVGAQSTTLLLAYMGSFITIMMVYMAQGTPLLSVLNSKAIASEILHTFVGCIGLVVVSPITAIICSYFYSPHIFKHDKIKNKLNEGC